MKLSKKLDKFIVSNESDTKVELSDVEKKILRSLKTESFRFSSGRSAKVVKSDFFVEGDRVVLFTDIVGLHSESVCHQIAQRFSDRELVESVEIDECDKKIQRAKRIKIKVKNVKC